MEAISMGLMKYAGKSATKRPKEQESPSTIQSPDSPSTATPTTQASEQT